MKYRKDIDGLRCIAVMSVVFFHLEVSFFDGGFLGVDVFFVISGYLITTLLTTENSITAPSLCSFYVRRIRRIIPALFLVVFLATVVAFFILPPKELARYGHELLYLSLFGTNIYYQKTADYFSPDIGLSPLIHTWSLSVEEQFYLIYPLFIFIAYKCFKNLLAFSVFILFLCSLCFSFYLELNALNTARFFNGLPRIWELLAGSLVSLYKFDQIQLGRKFLSVLSSMSLFFLIFCLMFFDQHYASITLQTCIIVFLTAVIIAVTREGTLSFKVITVKPFVKVGLVSYGIYLIHQPLIVFFNYATDAYSGAFYPIVVVVTCLLLAFLSNKYVESPIRNNKSLKPSFFLIMFICFSTFCLSVGAYLYKSNGLPTRYKELASVSRSEISPKRMECHGDPGSIALSKICNLNGFKHKKWAVFGDSHGVELAYSLARQLKGFAIGVEQYTASACGPALPNITQDEVCRRWQQAALQKIVNDEAVHVVVLAFRDPMFSEQGYYKYRQSLSDSIFTNLIDKFSGNVDFDRYNNLMWENYNFIIKGILKSGKRVVLIEPFPSLKFDVDRVIFPKTILSPSDYVDRSKLKKISQYLDENYFLLSRHGQLSLLDNVDIVSVRDVFCDSEFCYAMSGSDVLYFDSNHPSLNATDKVSEIILKRVMKM